MEERTLEISEKIRILQIEEAKKEEEIDAVDAFMDLLASEDIDVAFTREKPDLEDFVTDSNGNELIYERNITRKPANVKLPLTKEHVEEMNYCFQHPIYTIKNYAKIVSQDRGIIDFKLYPYQCEFIQTCFSSKRVISKFPRQSGKTTTSAAFMLIFSMFNENKTIAIVANKQSTATEILDRIKLMYEFLPMWLKGGIIEWNKTSIKFENGCKIMASSTSSSSIRGQSISLLYLDEFAFIQKNLVNEFIESTFPVISSSRLARIIITSTPNGKNHFYQFYQDALNGNSDFTPLSIEWNEVPGRDEEWRIKMIKELGSVEKFNQEYGGNFASDSSMAFSSETVKFIERNHVKDHILDEVEGVKRLDGLKVFTTPVRGRKYLICVDVAGGKNKDYSTMVVIDITNDNSFEIVCTYRNNKITPIEYPKVIYEVALYYYEAYLLIENNAMGAGVLNDIWNDIEYTNVYSSDFTRTNRTLKKAYHELGINTNKKTKLSGVLFLSAMLDKYQIIIPDIMLIDELYTFIKNVNGTYSASDGNHDDLVMPLVFFAYLVKTRDSFDLLKASYVDLEDEDSIARMDDNVFYIEGGRTSSNKEKAEEDVDKLVYDMLISW